MRVWDGLALGLTTEPHDDPARAGLSMMAVVVAVVLLPAPVVSVGDGLADGVLSVGVGVGPTVGEFDGVGVGLADDPPGLVLGLALAFGDGVGEQATRGVVLVAPRWPAGPVGSWLGLNTKRGPVPCGDPELGWAGARCPPG